MAPFGPHMKIYNRVAYGSLASFYLLDDRQYRAPQACPRPGRGGSNSVDVAACAELEDPARSLLGRAQERWLDGALAASRSRWNVLAQQTPLAQFDQLPGEGRRVWTDGWDGYPASRTRLLEALVRHRTPNPVAIGGDVHTFLASELKSDFDDPRSPVVASEFVGGSITSQSRPQSQLDRLLPDNPHILFGDSRRRGYARVQLDARRMRVELRAMEHVRSPDAACSTLASFVVEDGRPGPQRA